MAYSRTQAIPSAYETSIIEDPDERRSLKIDAETGERPHIEDHYAEESADSRNRRGSLRGTGNPLADQ